MLFIHSLVNGHLNYFQFLPIFNNLALKIYVQIFCGDMFSILLDINLSVELLGHMVTLCLTVKLGYFLIVEL